MQIYKDDLVENDSKLLKFDFMTLLGWSGVSSG